MACLLQSVFVTLVIYKLIVHSMFDQDALLEYLSSPEGTNKIIVGIILIGAMNAIFITYSVRSIFGASKKEKDRFMLQQEKINKLSPKKE